MKMMDYAKETKKKFKRRRKDETKVAAVLEGARDIISDFDSWAIHTESRNAIGLSVPLHTSTVEKGDVCQVCAVGATHAAAICVNGYHNDLSVPYGRWD